MSDLRSKPHQSWTRDEFLVSTDPTLISVQQLNRAYATQEMHWARSLPDDVLVETLRNSLCFGMYKKINRQSEADDIEHTGSTDVVDSNATEMIGFARVITDFSTFAYLTDVYTFPSHRGKGLGSWMVTCVREVLDGMPYLRQVLLFTDDWQRSVPFYEKLLGAEVLESKRPTPDSPEHTVAILSSLGKGHPKHMTGSK